jgi:hypothetical protein
MLTDLSHTIADVNQRVKNIEEEKMALVRQLESLELELDSAKTASSSW